MNERPTKSTVVAAVALAVILGIVVTWSAHRPPPRPSKPALEHAAGFTPSYEQEQWFLATCGVLTRRNKGRFDLLGGVNPTKKNAETWQRVLQSGWDVYNREDLLEALASLRDYGHRGAFEDMSERLATADSASLAALHASALVDPELANSIDIVTEYHDALGEKSLMGWDYSRYVALCGWGFVAGYLTHDEAWELLIPAARLLQRTFGSWRELGENYIIGRRFWSRRQTQKDGAKYEVAFEWLCTNPESPWVRIPWDLDLGEP